jgi:hypothetical protein
MRPAAAGAASNAITAPRVSAAMAPPYLGAAAKHAGEPSWQTTM